MSKIKKITINNLPKNKKKTKHKKIFHKMISFYSKIKSLMTLKVKFYQNCKNPIEEIRDLN